MWEVASALPHSSHTSLEQIQTQVSWLQIQCTSPNHFHPPASFKYRSTNIREHPGAYRYWLALEMAGNKQAGFFPCRNLCIRVITLLSGQFVGKHGAYSSHATLTARWELSFASLRHMLMFSGCAVSSEMPSKHLNSGLASKMGRQNRRFLGGG